jgi:hypothetical protein
MIFEVFKAFKLSSELTEQRKKNRQITAAT